MAKRTCKSCGKRFEGDARRRYCSAECRTGKPAAPRALRAVDPDEAPPPAEPEAPDPLKPRTLGVVEAFEDGTDLEQLLALRRHLATLLAGAAPRDAAALSRQLRELGREITALELSLREEAEDAAVTPDEAWDEEAI